MLEDIKKEIELYILKNHKDRYDELIDNIFEILDKYNNSKPKSITQLTKEQLEDLCLNLMHTDKIKTNYVRAWEELKTNEMAVDKISLDIMQELEQKYNLGTNNIDKTRLKYNQLQKENTQLKQQLKNIEEYLESIKDMPDADMYIELGEYKEFKHILDLIHKGSE